MNKVLFSVGTLAILAIANADAAAPVSSVQNVSSGSNLSSTVHFVGEITAGTCVVKTASKAQTITLPVVNNQMFSGDGSTTGNKQFTLDFTGCSTTTGGATAYAVHFDGTNAGSKTNLLQANRAGSSTAATDVGIEVDEVSSNTPLTFSTGAGNKDVPLTPNSAGDATLSLVAKYQQIGATIPAAGQITADMTYTVVYK